MIDNLGGVVRTYQYDGDGVSLSDFSTAAITDAIPTADASKVRALTVDSYDDQGRVYQSQLYQIDQANGTSGLTDAQILALPNLATNTFYNHRGDVMAVFSPGGQVTKSVYDGADRLAVQYTSDGGAVGNSDVPLMNWSAASTVQSDIVLSQTEYTHDGDGNVISTVTRERAHDASGTEKQFYVKCSAKIGQKWPNQPCAGGGRTDAAGWAMSPVSSSLKRGHSGTFGDIGCRGGDKLKDSAN